MIQKIMLIASADENIHQYQAIEEAIKVSLDVRVVVRLQYRGREYVVNSQEIIDSILKAGMK